VPRPVSPDGARSPAGVDEVPGRRGHQARQARAASPQAGRGRLPGQRATPTGFVTASGAGGYRECVPANSSASPKAANTSASWNTVLRLIPAVVTLNTCRVCRW